MTDVSLNGLKVKTDSLPNDWYVSLINPKSQEPAEIMTIAQFIELLIDKAKIWTQNNDGVIFTNRGSITESELDTFVSRDSGAIEVRLAGSQALMLNFNHITGSASGMQFYGRYSGSSLFYRTCIDNNRYSSWKSIMMADTVSANALTDTIPTSPVPESRQVPPTCLHIHLYQILLPTDRKRMVQYQLKVNQPRCRSSTFGLSIKLERQYLNCKKKINISNKSSRLTA